MFDLELEHFKQNINLVEFIQQHGGQILPRSSANSYRVRFSNDILTINKNNNGHWTYHVKTSLENRGGTIIDFCQQYLGISNLGEVRKYLRSYQLTSNISLPFNQQQHKTHKTHEIFDIDFETLKNHKLWQERGLDFNQIFTFLVEVKTDKHNNLLFKIVDENNHTIGYEVKNTKGFKGNIGSKQGLVKLGIDNKNIIVSESVIDSLSFYQLKQNELKLLSVNTTLISTSGQLTEKQMFMLKDMISNNDNRMFLCFDNDNAGQVYIEKVKNYFQNYEKNITICKPKCKDWSDELKLKYVGQMERVCMAKQIQRERR